MNWWEWIILLWGVALLFGGIGIFCDSQPWWGLWWAFYGPAIGFALFALIFSITLPLVVLNRSVTAEDCHNWGVQNNRPSKFASYTFWRYGCVTPDGHGHWIPTNQIIVNVPKGES